MQLKRRRYREADLDQHPLLNGILSIASLMSVN